MSIGTFTPTTAYTHVWQYVPGVLDATFRPADAAQSGATTYAVKIQWERDATKPLPGGGRVPLAANEGRLVFWKAGAAATDPKTGDELTIANVKWTVVFVEEPGWGLWVLTVQKQLTNA